MSFGSEVMVTRFNRRNERINTTMGLVILQNKSISASSTIASTVDNLLQRPHLKARLRKELT